MPVNIESEKALGVYLEGVGREVLLGDREMDMCKKNPSYGLLKDLLHFKTKETGSYKDMCKWWEKLTGIKLTEREITLASRKCKETVSKLQPSAHRPEGRSRLQSFLDLHVAAPHSESDGPHQSSSSSSAFPNQSTAESCQPKNSLVLKLAEKGLALVASRRTIKSLEEEVETLKNALKTTTALPSVGEKETLTSFLQMLSLQKTLCCPLFPQKDPFLLRNLKTLG